MEEKIKYELLNKIETLTDSYAYNEILNSNYSNRELFQILEQLEYDDYVQKSYLEYEEE